MGLGCAGLVIVSAFAVAVIVLFCGALIAASKDKI
jgi:hypothetical protein